jgi:hypothetical protein
MDIVLFNMELPVDSAENGMTAEALGADLKASKGGES